MGQVRNVWTERGRRPAVAVLRLKSLRRCPSSQLAKAPKEGRGCNGCAGEGFHSSWLLACSQQNFQFYLLCPSPPPPVSPLQGRFCLPAQGALQGLASSFLPASCFLLLYSHTVKQMTQSDFRQKPCLSWSPRQMNSAFSMPGKPQYAPTHPASHTSHNTETSFSYI